MRAVQRMRGAGSDSEYRFAPSATQGIMSEVELVGQAGSPESTLGHLMLRGPGNGQVEMSSGQKVERKGHTGRRHVEIIPLLKQGRWEGEKQPEVCSGVFKNRE